jgi:hypothetical protein
MLVRTLILIGFTLISIAIAAAIALLQQRWPAFRSRGADRAMWTAGGLGAFGVLTCLVVFVGALFSGPSADIEDQQKYQALMEPHADRFPLEPETLPIGGRLPPTPRVLYIVERESEQRDAARPRFERLYWPKLNPVPPERFAQQPAEVNTLVIVRHLTFETGRYNNGAPALTQHWRATVVNVAERTRIAERTFYGPPPAKEIVLGRSYLGSTTGDDPAGVPEWVDAVLTGSAPQDDLIRLEGPK